MTATSLLPLYFLSGKSPVTNPKFPPALKPGHPLYEEAWEILNLYYFSWLRDVCRRLGVAENDLDDRVQDVLCRLARRISKFDYQGSKGRFRAYLKRMAKNCAINAWRKLDQDMLGHTVDPASLGLPDDSVEELAGTVRGGVEIEIEKAERDRVHAEALTAIQEMISDHQYNMFKEYVLNERPVQEVAQQFGVRPSTVYANSCRTTKRLRQLAQRNRN